MKQLIPPIFFSLNKSRKIILVFFIFGLTLLGFCYRLIDLKLDNCIFQDKKLCFGGEKYEKSTHIYIFALIAIAPPMAAPA